MAPNARAVWAWAPPSGEPLDPVALGSFVARHGLGEVYLSVPWDLEGHHAALRATVASLHARGVTVAALGGEPGWAERPDQARQWAKRAFDVTDFDRLHLDIEPWGHQDWDRDRQRLIGGYLEAISASKGAARRPCDVDVAHFLHDMESPGGTLLADVLGVVDGITVMAYRGSVDGVVSIAEPSAAAAVQAGRTFRIGIQVGPGPDSFGAARAVELACTNIFRHFCDHPGFAGVAMHHYLDWRRLPAG